MTTGYTLYLTGLLIVFSMISPCQAQDHPQIRDLDGLTIPNAYWVLESIKKDGKDVPESEINKLNQVLIIKDKFFFLSRNGKPDYYGPIDYIKNREDKNEKGIVNFSCDNPIGGGVVIHLARFRMHVDAEPSRSRNIRMTLAIRRQPEVLHRAGFDDKKPGLEIETYFLR